MPNFRFIPITPRGSFLPKAAVLTGLKRAVTNTVVEGTRFMAAYPPQRLTKTGYKRTGTLKRSWSFTPAVQRGDRIEAETGSNSGMAPYNREVEGKAGQQRDMFRGAGWQNVDDLEKKMQAELPKRAQAEIDRLAGVRR